MRDPRIGERVRAELEGGLLWPDPLTQLNPAFAPGGSVDDLVGSGLLHPECANVFRKDKPALGSGGQPMRLHKHQADAVEAARRGDNYVLTTGTGSGKSIAYIVPIVDHVLRNGTGKGIQAVIVYPMNALANSQEGELRKFLCHGYADRKGPVTFQRYTGQENDEKKQAIVENPPDILLTNYVMLELILTRPREEALVKAASGLRFLVFDELHTYRGRQGADVAMLIRRARELLGKGKLQCVGTSATMSSEGTSADRRKKVAEVATTIFGAEVTAANVIGETLRRSTNDVDVTHPDFVERLRKRLAPAAAVPTRFADFIDDPLAIWLEGTFGVQKEPGTGVLTRSAPIAITGDEGAAKKLSVLAGVDVDTAASRIREGLMAGYTCEPDPTTGFRPFAFRLHQFVSRGDTVFASLDPPEQRYITLRKQSFAPNDRSRRLLPLVFCRECGQEYFSVRRRVDAEGHVFLDAREVQDQAGEEGNEPGFLYVNPADPWPTDPQDVVDRLPEDWLEEHRGAQRVRANRREHLPREVRFTLDGREDDTNGHAMIWLTTPFRFCLSCGVAYSARRRSDFDKLGALGSEGRSTATTILTLSAVRHLRDTDLGEEAKKLLSFTDNRQDASLQAGHFNDFIEVGLLRAGLYRACSQAPNGLMHDELTQAVFKALALPVDRFAADPAVRFQRAEETAKALRDVLGYRLYRDQLRGWRIMQPNLEQCGLLSIEYASLEELCAAPDVWAHLHPALGTATPDTRRRLCTTLLDYLRRELCLRSEYLERDFQERMQLRSSQHLIAPWGLDDTEYLERACTAFPCPTGEAGDERRDVYVSERSGFAQFIGRQGTMPNWNARFTFDDKRQIVSELFEALRVAGIVERVAEPEGPAGVPGYQVLAGSMRWRAGDGTQAFHDPIRVPRTPEDGLRTNDFFVEFYQSIARDLLGMEAREHTAQVPSEERERREDEFRSGRLPVLYCSPTMELGVDIKDLNVVNMRNVPPTPANYAQRSGRAGRSGQPALVFTYASLGSAHDQYFFRHQSMMVAGSVRAPRLDLANEDLIRSHVHAVWLAESSLDLGTSLTDLLDVSGERPTLDLQPHVKDTFAYAPARTRARERALRVLDSLGSTVKDADWFHDEWLDTVLSQLQQSFESACGRWRTLYRAAKKQLDEQHRISLDASRSADDRDAARGLRREAEKQLELLTEAEHVQQSDFYSYRYFAAEGFLPGYNFPRLPLSAYIPGRWTRSKSDEYVSRPRFLAISEFGPRAFIYHEGARFVIHKVILPVDDPDLRTGSAKLCEDCGHLHPTDVNGGPDLCQRCGEALPAPLLRLFRLQNVSTKRRDRISSDEEERTRFGYEVRTAVRFEAVDQRTGAARVRTARVMDGEQLIGTLVYGHAATLWRINLGWRRRQNPAVTGFLLDVERGYWERNDAAPETNTEERMSARIERVIPYVEDHRNALVFAPSEDLSLGQMASLQAALKNAIQVRFQLEEMELAVEPLPKPQDRRQLLFYEAAEGGAGALRQLVDDADAFRETIDEALRRCHYEPSTGADIAETLHPKEPCTAACYECLMSYMNQPDHINLDRSSIAPFLLRLRHARLESSPTARPRAEHFAALKRGCQSKLEEEWLDFLEANRFPLPTRAQALIERASTRPDFIYDDEHFCIYVDGPPHDYAERQARDAPREDALADLGFSVVRFHHRDDWTAVAARYPSLFRRPA